MSQKQRFKKQFSVYLHPLLLKLLDAKCKEQGIKKSTLIEVAVLRLFVEDLSIDELVAPFYQTPSEREALYESMLELAIEDDDIEEQEMITSDLRRIRIAKRLFFEMDSIKLECE